MTAARFDTLPRASWVEIDGAILANNARAWKTVAGDRKLLVVVKANGYGHGLVGAAKAFVVGGADYLGVANIAEGAILRDAEIAANILALGYVDAEEAEIAIRLGIDFFFWTEKQLALYAALAAARGKRARLHLKIDTGMGRLGCLPLQALALARAAAAADSVDFVGVASHFAEADMPSLDRLAEQAGLFAALLDDLAAAGVRPPLAHIANTPATLRASDTRLDMCRVGIGAYGLKPDPAIPLTATIRPALRWIARGAPPRQFAAGTPLSYGGEYRAAEGEWISVLPIGYADGFRRSPQNINHVLIGGCDHAIVGRVCMDQCLVRLFGPAADGRPEAVLIGTSGDLEITAEDLAVAWGTNVYDVVCGINERVPRRYR